jgi:hypothetical protein
MGFQIHSHRTPPSVSLISPNPSLFFCRLIFLLFYVCFFSNWAEIFGPLKAELNWVLYRVFDFSGFWPVGFSPSLITRKFWSFDFQLLYIHIKKGFSTFWSYFLWIFHYLESDWSKFPPKIEPICVFDPSLDLRKNEGKISLGYKVLAIE